MLRAISDNAVANAAQLPPQKSTRADAPERDSFASLVNGNASTADDDRANCTKEQPPRQQTDETVAQNPGAEDDNAAPRRSQSCSNSPNGNAGGVEPVRASPKTDAPVLSQLITFENADKVTPDSKSAGAPERVADEATIATVDAALITTPAPVATLIPVIAPLASVAAVLRAPAPLAIAAAAINTSLKVEGAGSPLSIANPPDDISPATNSMASVAFGLPANALDTIPEANSPSPPNVPVLDAAPIPQKAASDIPVAIEKQAAAAVTAAMAPIAVRTGFTASSTARAGSTTPDDLKVAPSNEASQTVAPSNIPTAAARAPLAAEKVEANAFADAGPRNAPSLETSRPPTSAHQQTTASAPDQPQADLSSLSNQTNSLPQQLTQPILAWVNQTGATATVLPAVPLQALAIQIAATAQSGRSRFEIRLDPTELGRIDVRIDIDRHGQVTSHLTVEKPETLAMLRQDAPHLQRALDDAGFKTGGGGLQFSLRDQSSSGQNNSEEFSRPTQRLIISEDDSMAAATVGRTYGRMLTASSGVDIRV